MRTSAFGIFGRRLKAKLGAPLAVALLAFASNAQAQVFGVDVQVSNGKKSPSIEQLRLVLNPGDFVRDVLGWQRVDRKCNLTADPNPQVAIPAAMAALYANVQAAGGRNFVTLGFNNKFCGQTSTGGGDTFPDNPALIAEFAAYAAAVVRQVPALGGISIWNELNGTWNGGYATRAEKLAHYCALSNAVIAAVRQVSPTLPIAIGGTVGADIADWFIEMFDVYGCAGKGDATIWLDVHPYLSGKIDKAQRKVDWTVWNDSIQRLRARGIDNPLAATEWGAKSAYTWQSAHTKGNYMKTFRARVLSQDAHWATALWFEMLYDRSMPNAGLFDSTGTALTPLGMQYTAEFRR